MVNYSIYSLYDPIYGQTENERTIDKLFLSKTGNGAIKSKNSALLVKGQVTARLKLIQLIRKLNLI